MEYRGLTEAEAAERLVKHGRNELQELKRESLLAKFLRQFQSFMILLLLGAAVIALFLGEQLDALMIFGIVLMLGILGFIQEYKAEKAFEALKKLVSPKTRVVREGAVKIVDAREIVPGDVVVLETGDRVPADGLVIESMEMKIDEASLTGESIPVRKDVHHANKVFAGTIVISGRGKALVEKTGMATEIGKIATFVQAVEVEKTPLEISLDKVGKQMSVGVVVLCAVIFIAGILHGFEAFHMFLTAVSLAVAAIPEGLPAVITIALALGVQRMSKRNAIVRRLKSVETLGSADVICTDKTGTLTKNEMTAKKVFVNWKMIDVSGSGYETEGEFIYDGQRLPTGKGMDKGLALLLRIGALCNNAHLREGEKGKTEVIGDTTEGALLILAAKAQMYEDKLLKEEPKIGELPFDSNRKRMSVICKKDRHAIAYLKGAPESILEISTKIFENGKVRALTSADTKRIVEINDSLTSKGYRTLALGYKDTDRTKFEIKNIERDIVFVGLVGIMDTPREEVKPALQLCRSAGIRVIMITGDHPLTARTIGEELGIDSGAILTGREVDAMSESELLEAVERVSLFARVSPAHKLRIVEALLKRGHVVAVTGDGVNDAPALKRADIGVAMGITGTDVAKESSDLILTDDNFATIVSAVEEGRGIYENIRKTLMYLLSGNIAEVMVIFLAVMLGLPLPLVAVQILWINLVTDGLPAIALAVDPVSKEIMARPPRKKSEDIWKGANLFLIESPLIMMGSILAVFYIDLQSGDLVLAQTMTFTLFVILEKTKAFVCRSLEKPVGWALFENKWLVYATLLTIALHIFILYTPFCNELFQVKPIGLQDWAEAIAISVLFYIYLEIRKYYIARKASKKTSTTAVA
ncbi:MAG: cation-translocating P-type ATPase [Candidatus Bilamarchaeaceae archaeon]